MKPLNRSNAPDESLARYFEEIAKTPLLTFDQELELSRQVEAGNQMAQGKLIQANLRLVVKIAKAYSHCGTSFLDLIQEGNLGLMKAAAKFDYRKNVRFSTYASWWIKQSIVRALVNKNRLIRLPHRKEEALRKLMNTIAETPDSRQALTVDELARQLIIPRDEVLALLDFSGAIASLDREIGDESVSLLEMIEDRQYQPEQQYLEQSIREDTQQLLASLQRRERDILLERYAFQGGKKSTLKTIGQRMGLSAETVRQLELRALDKLRLQKELVRDYLYN